MKIISFICFSLFSFYSFSDSCQQTFSNLKTKTKASIEIAQTEVFQSNTKISKLKSKTKISTSKISDIYFREKFQDEKYTLKYLERMNKFSSIQKIAAIYPVLTGKEQIELIKIYQEYQDQRSLYILLFSNFRLIHLIIGKRIKNRRYKFDDYFQESVLVFMKAIKLFDPYKGIMFSTYLGRAIKNNLNFYHIKDATFRVSFDLKDKLYILHQERQANPEMIGTDIWIENVIKKYPKEGFTKARIREILLHSFNQYGEPIYEFNDASINKNREAKEEGVFVIDDLSDPQNQEIFDLIDSKHEIDKFAELTKKEIESQTDKEILQRILETQLFVSEPIVSLKQIKKEFNVPYMHVRVLNKHLIEKAKEHINSGKTF